MLIPSILETKRLLLAGKSPKQIRELLNVSSCFISYHRKALGLKPFGRGSPKGFRPLSKERADIARKMKVDGFTYQAIANKFGITRQRVQQYLRPRTNMGESCERCGAQNVIRHRHHKNYETDECEILCVNCHAKFHAPATATRNRAIALARRALNPPKAKFMKCFRATFNGKTQRFSEWAAEVGIPQTVLHMRIRFLKWPIEKALFHPVGRYQKKIPN